MTFLKIGGIAVFGIAALAASGFTFEPASGSVDAIPISGFTASVALSILAFKGFTTITNSGAEIVDPHRNVDRTIIFSIAICVVVYLLVAFTVGSSRSLEEIVAAKDYSPAEAAEPGLGPYGFYFTIALAVVATASGLLASVFAVSRKLAILTDMEMIPHSHFGMSGSTPRSKLAIAVLLLGQRASSRRIREVPGP